MPLLAFLAGFVLAVCAGCTTRDLREVPLDSVRQHIDTNAQILHSPHRIDLDIGPEGAYVVIPVRGPQALELSVKSDSIFTLTYAAIAGPGASPFGPPWRYRVLRPGSAVVLLDFLETPRWSPASIPFIKLDGAGHVSIERVRWSPPPAGGDFAAGAFDAAQRWAPESIGHTTINTLAAPLWRASRHTYLADVVAGLSACAGLATMLVTRRLRGRFTPSAAFAVSIVVAAIAWDGCFLARFLPVARLSVDVDVNRRIRDNYYFAPELGAVAAIARKDLRPEERVGVIASPHDWFSGEVMCFNLAPRPCAVVRHGESVSAGISSVTQLKSEDLDAVVSFVGDAALPPGFVPFARLTPRALIARRP